MSPMYPNGTSDPSCNTTIDCSEGCLFNIFDDPSEHTNLAQSQPEKLQEMIQLLAQLNQTYFDPIRSGGDPKLAAKVRKDCVLHVSTYFDVSVGGDGKVRRLLGPVFALEDCC